jgi:peptidyl-prolyl cis-trans isomerase A (cyclophilin A)
LRLESAPRLRHRKEENLFEDSPMRRFARSLWKSFAGPRKTRRPFTRRLELEALEIRAVPAALGSVTALAYVDVNHDGRFDAGDTVLPVIPATLTGTTTTGAKVQQVFTSGLNGKVTFFELPAGTYQVSFAGLSPKYTGRGVISGIKVAAGQNVQVSVGFLGLAPTAINLNEFLNTSTPDNFRFQGPVATHAISPVTLTGAGTSETINLAAHFGATDITNSLVQVNTVSGPMLVQMFDSAAPQTVANFYDYVNSGAYTNTFFHRNGTNDTNAQTRLPVLQGGGFTTHAPSPTSNITSISVIPTNPPVNNEFGVPNVTDTIAMAKGADPNSATDQFFFNLANNSSVLGANNTGGFTVFGGLLGSNDDATITALKGIPVHNESQVPPTRINGAFNTLPITATGYQDQDPNFPTNLKPNQLASISNVLTVTRPEFLTYSVVSNSNPSVAAVFLANERLTVNGLSTGTTTITVQARDVLGGTATQSFTVTVA